MNIFQTPVRSPDDAPSGQAAAPSKSPAPAPRLSPKAPSAEPRTPGPQGRGEPAPSADNIQESAADRAIARKAAADAAGQKKEKPKPAKVKSLEEIKKLSSQNVRERKTNSVETDNMALPEPKPEPARAELEDGRPDPKRARKAAPPEMEEPGLEQEEVLEDDFPAPIDLVDAEVEEEVVQDDPVFTPNLKFKAYGEEFDIPERFQGLITDAESEKEVHSVFSRAHAFDKTNGRLREADDHIRTILHPRLNQYENIGRELTELAQSGDIFGLAERFNLDPNKVLMAAAERIRMEQADPAVRAEHERRVAAEKRDRESTRRIEQLEAQNADIARTQKTRDFESLLARDDVSAVEKEFDERQGKTGSFRKMIQQRAQSIYLNSKIAADAGKGQIVDLTPAQAIQGFMQEYGLTLSPSAPGPKKAPQANPGQARVPNAAAPNRTPKAIPNIKSRPATPGTAKPEFKSIKEIEAFRKQNYGR